MAANPPPSATPPPSPTKRRLTLWFSALGVLLVLGVAGIFGWEMYGRMRERRIVSRAQELLEKKDYAQALIAAEWALRISPKSLGAAKVMAQLADIGNSPQAVHWHRAVAESEPGVLENQLRWAAAALRIGNVAMAQRAIANVGEDARNSAAYHGIAGRVAHASDHHAEAEGHFLQAIKLEPDNVEHQFGLASVRLFSIDPGVHDAARKEVEKFGARPEFRRVAYRSLIKDNFRRGEWKEGFLLAAELQAIPDAPFEDRMLLLELLRAANRPELHSYLMDVQAFAAKDPETTALLIGWMNRSAMSLVAADWARSLPAEVRTRHPVPAAVAESYANLKDWKRLKELVGEGNWESFEYLRLAFLARVLREEGDVLTSRNYWTAATRIVSGRQDATEALVRIAAAARWETETTDLLWQVARGNANQGWAIDALNREYLDKGNTRGLLNVAIRAAELNPKDPLASAKIAGLLLLLDKEIERAIKIAREVRGQKPEDGSIAVLCAYAAHLEGRTEEGAQILKDLKNVGEVMAKDATAAAFGAVVSVEAGLSELARTAIQQAEAQRLLPEQAKLVAQAKGKLGLAGSGDAVSR